MDNSQLDVVQELLDAISRLPEDDQEKVGRELSELIDNIPELPLEGGSMMGVAHAASPSNTPSSSKETNDRKQQQNESKIELHPRGTKQLDLGLEPSLSRILTRGTSDPEPSHAEGLCPPAVSIVRQYSDMSAGPACTIDKESIQDEKKMDSGSVLHSPPEAVRGPRATKDIQATHAPNPGDLRAEEKSAVTAEVSGSSNSVNNRLLKTSNAYEPNSMPLPRENLSNRHVERQSEPGMYTPGLRRNVGAQSPVPPVHGQVPFALPDSSGIRATSFQGNSVPTPFLYPPMPMPYPGLPVVLPPGYGNLPIPMQRTSSTDQVPVRRPFGNSQRANVDATEAPRASKAGPSRAGRKGSKKAAHKEAVVYVCELPDCPLPGKQFHDKRELLRHQKYTKAHSENKFPCPMCHKKIGRKDVVKRHLRNIHKCSEVVTES